MDGWEIVRGVLLFYLKLVAFAGGTYFCAKIWVGGWDDLGYDGADTLTKLGRTTAALAFCGLWVGQAGEKQDFWNTFAMACLILIPSTWLASIWLEQKHRSK